MMNDEWIPELLASVLCRHFNVNGITVDWVERLHCELNWAGSPERASLFRLQLEEAIQYNTITPKKYEQLTEEDFDSQADLNVWLHKTWKALYGNESDKKNE
jgi:hypothetical protein